jgi:hypothetical protein
LDGKLMGGGTNALEYPSWVSSLAAMAEKTSLASSTEWAKMDTQSKERQAGTTPLVLIIPREGLTPTRPLNMAGTCGIIYSAYKP